MSAANLKVVPLRHPWRWATATCVILAIVFFASAIIGNPELQWQIVGHYLFHPFILRGLCYTVALTAIIMVLASVVGTAVALMMMSPSRLLSTPASAFVWWFRGTPALVQLILWYNLSLIFPKIGLVLPGFGTIFAVPTNDVMTPLLAAVAALSLHESGYMAEIVRNGLKSVNKGQTEASLCLGISPANTLRRIVLPQAMRVIIPPTGNETINLLKTTSLVSIIAVGDLLYSAQAIYARTFETVPLLIVVTLWYLVVVSLMTIGQSHLERHFARDEELSQTSPGPGWFNRLLGRA